jgi:hypothetical protein
MFGVQTQTDDYTSHNYAAWSGKYVDLTCLVQVLYVFLLSLDINSGVYHTKWPASYPVFCM